MIRLIESAEDTECLTDLDSFFLDKLSCIWEQALRFLYSMIYLPLKVLFILPFWADTVLKYHAPKKLIITKRCQGETGRGN